MNPARVPSLPLIGLALAAACTAPAQPAGSDAAWYDQAPWAARAEPVAIETRALHVTARDGTRLAVTVRLPADRESGAPLTAVLRQTRYWRDVVPHDPAIDVVPPPVRRFLGAGYAHVTLDCRGSGASFGTRRHLFSPEEVADGVDVVDWIVAQPWSDGRVVVEGFSYLGTTAELTLDQRHPAVVAAIPAFTFFDVYDDLSYPGGVRLAGLTRVWGDFVDRLDVNDAATSGHAWYEANVAGVAPVDSDADGELLAAAIAEHADNFDVDAFMSSVQFRDEARADPFGAPMTVDAFSPHRFAAAVEGELAPALWVTGWFDGGNATAVMERRRRRPGPRDRVLVGPWDHGIHRNVSPWSPSPVVAFDLWAEVLRFLDHHVRGRDVGYADEPPVRTFTMGAEAWRAWDEWPPADVAPRTLWFAPDGALSSDAPTTTAGEDVYAVEFEATTGPTNRWVSVANIGMLPIGYPDRAAQQARLLTYTSPPLDAPLEVTGHPEVVLHVASTATDGAVHAYLEDVAPDGTVRYVTEGSLRASHRALATPPGEAPPLTPYHTHAAADARPLVPGEVAELRFDLVATSYEFRAGHALRIGIAVADASWFARVPETGPAPVLSVQRSAAHPSHVVLPVRAPR